MVILSRKWTPGLAGDGSASFGQVRSRGAACASPPDVRLVMLQLDLVPRGSRFSQLSVLQDMF